MSVKEWARKWMFTITTLAIFGSLNGIIYFCINLDSTNEVSLSIALFALVISGFAIDVSRSSDRKMKAIANLDFDEMMTKLTYYNNNLGNLQPDDIKIA
ncbi:MAG: hypothetical protein ACXQS4_01940, partial [Methermicoccaceae archaeon]